MSYHFPGIFFTNGRVAWRMPMGRITRLFENGYYRLPEGWELVHGVQVLEEVKHFSDCYRITKDPG